MTDYIGPFGPESIEIVARAMCDAADESRGYALSWPILVESVRDSWRQDARLLLSAAVSGLDREELVDPIAQAIAHDLGFRHASRDDARTARAVIARLFPTEGEAT